jgi:AAA ATPase domain
MRHLRRDERLQLNVLYSAQGNHGSDGGVSLVPGVESPQITGVKLTPDLSLHVPKMRDAQITSVHFDHFKAFDQFTLSLHSVNVIVGPNNSGKSTIIGAFRALDAAIKFSR